MKDAFTISLSQVKTFAHSKLETFFSLKVYCVPGGVPFTLERTISAPVSDKSKRKHYLVLNYAKCASGCRCLRKAESREWPDLVISQ